MKPKSEIISRWAWLPLLALVLFLWSLLRDFRRDTESLQVTAESAEKQTAALRSPVRAEAPPQTSPTAAPLAKPPAPSPAKSGALESFSDGNALGEAEYGNIIARRHRRYALANHRPAVTSLHLPPADEEQLKSLLAAAWIAREDTGDVLTRMGDASPELRAKVIAAARAEGEQKIKAFLGDDNYTRLQAAYESSTTEKMNWQLVTDLWDAGLPLTPEQQTAYARAQLQAKAQFPVNSNQEAPDPQTGLTARDLALLQAAAGFLSPGQLEFIRNERIAETRSVQAVRDLRQLKAAPKPGP